MKITVDKKIIQKTTKCEKNFSCLKDNGKPICEVEFLLSDEVLILKCKESSKCSYQKPFDLSTVICTCPTRNEIYKKYSL